VPLNIVSESLAKIRRTAVMNQQTRRPRQKSNSGELDLDARSPQPLEEASNDQSIRGNKTVKSQMKAEEPETDRVDKKKVQHAPTSTRQEDQPGPVTVSGRLRTRNKQGETANVKKDAEQ